MWLAGSAPEEDVGHFDSVDPLEESQVSLVSSSASPYSSFPVDVVVYVRVQVNASKQLPCQHFLLLQRSASGYDKSSIILIELSKCVCV